MNFRTFFLSATLSLFIFVLGISAFVPKAFALSAPKCGDTKPSDTPRFKRIDAKPTQAKLYFTSVQDNNTYYYIAYGLRVGDLSFGTQFDQAASSGHWVKYTIHALSPGTTYSFAVRGGNGCKPGNWSSWVTVTTPKQGLQIIRY